MNPNMMARWFEDALVAARFVYFYARAETLNAHPGFANQAQVMNKKQRAIWALNKSLGRI